MVILELISLYKSWSVPRAAGSGFSPEQDALYPLWYMYPYIQQWLLWDFYVKKVPQNSYKIPIRDFIVLTKQAR